MLCLGLVAICLSHRLLELNCRSERVHGATKLDQAAVACQPDHSSATACSSRCEPSVQMFQKPRNGATLVTTHQPRRSDHVGKKDRRQTPLLSSQ